MGKSSRNYDWVIMGASAWIPGKPSLEKIAKENSDRECTIMVVERFNRPHRTGVKIFILGSAGDYGKVGDKVTFIQDTGMGYGADGYCVIENIITIDKNGNIKGENNKALDEKRPLWVFK